MDLMEIRRRLMMQMAAKGGADYISGTITIPSSGSTYKLDFGKTFNKYLYYVEMTDESKTALINSGATAVRAFAWVGIWPNVATNNVICTANSMYARYNPSTNEAGSGNMSASAYSNSSITFSTGSVLSSITTLYHGYSYKYTIVSLDNI